MNANKPEKCIIYDDFEDEFENVPTKYRNKARKKGKQPKVKKMKRNDS